MNATLRGSDLLRRYLDDVDGERAANEATRWIKALRTLPVEGVPFRDRFTYRGDSLWWFAELYLHKQGVIDRAWKIALALEALCRPGGPDALGSSADASGGLGTITLRSEGDRVLEWLAPQAAARHGLAVRLDPGTAGRRAVDTRLGVDLRSRFYTWSALASRARTRRRVAGRGSGGTLAFVHSAFWRKPAPADADDGHDLAQGQGQEGYIGAVLQALRGRAAAQPVRLVGVGPRTNFKARRWWHAIAPSHAGAGEIPVEPIETFASWRALAGSRAIWRERFAMERALLSSEAIRAHATILGYDIWPLLADELRGIARLQFPWSARAMDEAAAAMEATRPGLVVTYAEAGGWGRALMLEARRRGIPSVGVQHGFIYRHWLNYRHEPDEMQPSPANPADRGFPRPDRTLVYDGYAAQHLITAGHFPPEAIAITGSPALDALVASVSRVDADERARIRVALDAQGRAEDAVPFVLLVTKYTQVRDVLPDLLAAVAALRSVRLVIKPHPAETAEPYRLAAEAAGVRDVIIAPPAIDLARLLAVARVLVTVNSTVAIDAISLGVPACVIGLPNNLSPFVEAGVMAGAGARAGADDLAQRLGSLLHDDAQREALLARGRAFAARYAITPDGRAAERAADVMTGIMTGSRVGRAS